MLRLLCNLGKLGTIQTNVKSPSKATILGIGGIALVLLYLGMQTPTPKNPQITGSLPHGMAQPSELKSLAGNDSKVEVKSFQELKTEFIQLDGIINLDEKREARISLGVRMLANVSAAEFLDLLDFLDSEGSQLEISMLASSILARGEEIGAQFGEYLATKNTSKNFDGIIGGYLTSMAVENPLKIRDFLAQLPKTPAKDGFVGHSIQQLISNNFPDEAFRLLADNPDTTLPAYNIAGLASYGIQNKNALDLLRSFSQAGSRSTPQLAYTMLHEQAGIDLEQAKSMVATLGVSNAGIADDAMRGLVAKWMEYGSKAPTMWFNQLEKGNLRDAGINEFCLRLASTDPESASIWATAVTDPNLRESTAYAVYSSWKNADESLSNKWAEENFPNFLQREQKSQHEPAAPQ